MLAVAAFVSFIIAALVFLVNAAEWGNVDTAIGLFFVALGLALTVLGGVVGYIGART